jgi:hypothetical protein
MVKLKDQVQAASAERSILMSYCASLPFFEQEILPHLQTIGLGEVTVLLGEADYRASVSDYVQSAGVRYRFHPLRLPHPLANFHPKLYLLCGPLRTELLVASANLTPSGFQSNLEIVDRLVISAEERTDARAFGQYAEMLRRLAKLDPSLPQSVTRTLLQSAESIEKTVGGEVRSEGPHFLHSLDEPLLQQLRTIVGPLPVHRIDIISPFFDAKSTAVLKVAESFPDAKIHIVKDGSPQSLNGKALIHLGERVVVDEQVFAEDTPQRKLHAKVMALHGSGREWLITGSANMSRRAWLTRASEKAFAGNVEAIVVREVEPGTMATLLNGISKRRIDHTELRFSQPEQNSPLQSPVGIIDAQLEHGRIRVRLTAAEEDLREEGALLVFIEQNGRRMECSHSLKVDERVLSVDIGKHVLASDQAILLVVEFTSHKKSTSARAWVSVPSALLRTAEQRKMRDSVNYAASYLFPTDDESVPLAEALERFFGGFWGRLRSVPNASSKANTGMDEPSENELTEDDFIVLERDLGRVRQSVHKTLEHLSALANFLRDLVLAPNELAPADMEEDYDFDRGEHGNPHIPSAVSNLSAAVFLAKAAESFFETIAKALEQPINSVTAPLIMNIPGAALAFMELRAHVQKRCSLPKDHTFAYEMRDSLNRLLSLDGIIVGGTSGWLMLAMGSKGSRIQVEGVLTDAKRRKELESMVVAGLTLEGPIESSDTFASSILAGLEFLLGVSLRPGASGVEAAGKSEVIIDASDSTKDDIQNKLRGTLHIQAARRWSLLFRLEAARKKHENLTVLRSKLEESAPELLRQYDHACRDLSVPLTRVYATDSGMVGCGICGMVISPEEQRRLRILGPQAVLCKGKRHLLCPIDFTSPLSAMLDAWLRGQGKEVL